MVDHVIDALIRALGPKVRETQGRVIVVQFQCANPGRVGLKRQDLHVDHETVRLWRERWRTAESRLQA